ncbi:MAG: VOC family protein [Paraglaciecola sp.]|uniref:VOC family protein n=1 Tax=Paraglaciecola sp. TaxID=1920173 RepID=UPI003267E911
MLKFLFSSIFILIFTFNLNAKPSVLTDGLNHLGLTVSNLEKTTAFFTDTLGWEIKGGDPDYPATFVSDGSIFLTLWQTRSPQKTVPFDRKNNVGLHHLAITVISFDALNELHERFKNVEGVVIEFAPELAFGGPGKHMMIREPSGNRLEFIHRP